VLRAGAEGGWAVSAVVASGDRLVRLGTGFTPGEGAERARRVRIDGAPASGPDALLDHLRVLWLTPAMDGLFTGPASERRRFLDRLTLTLDPAHARASLDFERQVRSRNRLLSEGGPADWLDAVEAPLARAAIAVSEARSATVEALKARVAAQAAGGGAFPPAGLVLSGEFEDAYLGFEREEAETRYRRALAAARPRDRAAGRTLEGPHRSDLDVSFAEKGMPAALSSTGEQKALLIGLILAHADVVAARSGLSPVLLLDEVAAHLDPGRRRALFDRLDRLGCQAFMTGTEPGLFAGLGEDSERFAVTPDGRVEPA